MSIDIHFRISVTSETTFLFAANSTDLIINSNESGASIIISCPGTFSVWGTHTQSHLCRKDAYAGRAGTPVRFTKVNTNYE